MHSGRLFFRARNALLTTAGAASIILGAAASAQTQSAPDTADPPPPVAVQTDPNAPQPPGQPVSSSPPVGDASTANGEIVVTALKRATNLQQTPISISAVTEQNLIHLGATSVNDYFREVPNMQVEGNSPTARRITIRGVRAAGEATVGLYYDEAPLTGPNGTTQDAASTNPDVNLFDVERVEVLRGPQGTLYGAGSMGGTLRVIYNKAKTTDIEGAVEGQVTSTKDGGIGYYSKGMINLPVAKDVLGVRVIAYNEKRAGYVDDPVLNRKDINDGRSYGGRALVTFKPFDILTIYGSATYQKSTQDGQTSWYQRLGRKDYTTDARAIGRNNDELKLYNLTGKLDLDFGTLTLTSSHYVWDLLRSSDYTPTLNASRANATSCRNYIGITTACTPAQLASYTAYADSRLPGILYQPMHLNSWNHEARFSGTLFDKFLDYTVGVYYEKRKDRVDSQVVLASATTGEAIKPLDFTAWRYITDDQKQTAFFGELTAHPTSKLSLTAGIRHFDYKKIVGGQVLVSNYITQSYVGPYAEVNASAKGWVSKFNASYEFSRDLMVYATAAKGFRPGGANNVPGLTTGLVAFAPDSLWNYEVGMKSQWFDRMLTFNAALYQINWSNLQVSATSANGAFSFITNAGKARIRGGEAEITLRPLRGLTLSTGLGYTDARLTEDQANSLILISGSTGLDGDRFPNVPKFNANAVAEYSFPLTDELNGLLRGDFTYTGKSASQFRPTYVYYERQHAYETVNLRTGIEGHGWGGYLFVNNLFNAVGPLSVTSGVGSLKSLLSLTPRTIGVMARKSF